MQIKHLLLAGIYMLFCACAPFGSRGEQSLEQRVEQQDIQLRQMQPQQADAMNQIQAMRQEIEQLRGQLDDLNNAGGARALADRVRQHDAALRQVDTNMALNLDLGSPMGSQQAVSQPVAGIREPAIPQQQEFSPQIPATPETAGIKPGNSPDSSAYAPPKTSSNTGNYGLPDDAAPDNRVLPANGPSESTWGKADPKPVILEVPKKDISLALFDAGLNSFHARDYKSAERSFSDFLKNYPKHSQVAEAQYYLAECDFQQNRFPQAALAYDALIKKYPKSSFIPGAYLKQGIAFSKMDHKAAAKSRMQEIIAKFPNSPEAARAKNFLKTNK